MSLSSEAKKKWIKNVGNVFKPLIHARVFLEIITDASLQGWGASCQDISMGGLWSFEEQQQHINYLEINAIFLALKILQMT